MQPSTPYDSQVVKIIVLYPNVYIYSYINSRSLQQLGESLLMADHDGQDLVTILTQVGNGNGRDPFFFVVVLDGSRSPFIGQLIQPQVMALLPSLLVFLEKKRTRAATFDIHLRRIYYVILLAEERLRDC
jgi:hypothetical protein